MPIVAKDWQKRFIWTIELQSGAPVADVVDLGGIPYLSVCPLCGCLHEAQRGTTTGDVIKPRCLLREFAHGRAAGHWRFMYDKWLEKFPQAAKHDSVFCRTVSLEELNERTIAPEFKPQRKRARKDKAA